jgi:hypothetical protein
LQVPGHRLAFRMPDMIALAARAFDVAVVSLIFAVLI